MSEKGAIHLHQALHGYADGHRQFAVSTTLKPRDAKALLTLSDSSGPGARFPEGGYLTGYPLADSGLYALARTWPAPEMPRPGCVWTHTLLIPFTELGALDDFRDLSNLFRRPQTGSPETYQNVLSWTPKQTSTSAINGEDARYILAALYGDPRRRIVAAPKRSEPENLALAIWGQQWPRLRRSFRFCTFSAADRSIESAAFDLQLVPPGDASIRSRFPKALEADRNSLTSHRWVEIALKDLCSDGEHDLRTFFRRVGGDVAGGREAFASLCRLYELLHDLEGATQLANAMSLVDNEFGSAQGRYTRIVITREAARRSRELDEAGFDFLLRNLGFLSAGVDDEILDEVGEQIWTRRPQELAAFLNGGGMQQIAVERGLDALPPAALVKTLAVVPNVAGKVLERRPAVVCELISGPWMGSIASLPCRLRRPRRPAFKAPHARSLALVEANSQISQSTVWVL